MRQYIFLWIFLTHNWLNLWIQNPWMGRADWGKRGPTPRCRRWSCWSALFLSSSLGVCRAIRCWLLLLVKTPAKDVHYLWWGWSWNLSLIMRLSCLQRKCQLIGRTLIHSSVWLWRAFPASVPWCPRFEMRASLVLPKDSSGQFYSSTLENSSAPKRLRFQTSQVFTIHGGLVTAWTNLPQHSVFELMFPKFVW